jgi:hypothetical protein
MSIFIKQWIGSPSSSVCAVLISFALYSKKACSLIKPFDAFDFATGLFRALYASPKCVPEKPPSFGIYTCVNGSLSKEHILGSEEDFVSRPSGNEYCQARTRDQKANLTKHDQFGQPALTCHHRSKTYTLVTSTITFRFSLMRSSFRSSAVNSPCSIK